MNYRHAFHAGNHTELFKHAALVLLLGRLLAKPKPIMFLDTHAGLGMYAIDSSEALRTGEAAAGIGAVFENLSGEASTYASLVAPFIAQRVYPGSPAIAATMLRAEDRAIVCELHPEDFAVLRRNFSSDRRVAAHHRDGYVALTAFVPPPERRGLVFIDPPFEDRAEASRLGSRLAAAIRKWPTGTYMAWYPVKNAGVRDAILSSLSGPFVTNCLWAEFLRFRPDGIRLAGSGLVLVNAPWKFEETLWRLGADLVRSFGDRAGSIHVEWQKPPS